MLLNRILPAIDPFLRNIQPSLDREELELAKSLRLAGK